VIEKLLYLFYEKHWDQAHPRWAPPDHLPVDV